MRKTLFISALIVVASLLTSCSGDSTENFMIIVGVSVILLILVLSYNFAKSSKERDDSIYTPSEQQKSDDLYSMAEANMTVRVHSSSSNSNTTAHRSNVSEHPAKSYAPEAIAPSYPLECDPLEYVSVGNLVAGTTSVGAKNALIKLNSEGIEICHTDNFFKFAQGQLAPISDNITIAYTAIKSIEPLSKKLLGDLIHESKLSSSIYQGEDLISFVKSMGLHQYSIYAINYNESDVLIFLKENEDEDEPNCLANAFRRLERHVKNPKPLPVVTPAETYPKVGSPYDKPYKIFDYYYLGSLVASSNKLLDREKFALVRLDHIGITIYNVFDFDEYEAGIGSVFSCLSPIGFRNILDISVCDLDYIETLCDRGYIPEPRGMEKMRDKLDFGEMDYAFIVLAYTSDDNDTVSLVVFQIEDEFNAKDLAFSVTKKLKHNIYLLHEL